MTNANLYTYNPFTGISTGIELVQDGVNPRNQRPVPPHVACGPAFVAIENKWQHPPLDRTGRLQEASLHLIEPMSGAKPFEVLVPKHGLETKLYCFVDSTIPQGMKLKVQPEEVRAKYAVEQSDDARLVIWDKALQSYLIEFGADGATVDIWFETGHIARLVRRGPWIEQIPLTALEIAKERVWQFEDQVSNLADGVETDQKHRHGIIAAAIRLLRVASDQAVMDIYADFLIDQLPHLIDGLRREIRSVLLSKRHPSAGNFVSEWSANVVPIRSAQSAVGDSKAQARARKLAKAEEDRKIRSTMRGSSSGGGTKRKGK